jgi:hypothetical protein
MQSACRLKYHTEMSPQDDWSPPRESASAKAWKKFESSMVIGFDQWHDGLGYDLDALNELDEKDRRRAESLLASRLQGSGAGWRDVEAMAALDTPGAKAALKAALKHSSREVRMQAAEYAEEPKTGAALEQEIVSALRSGQQGSAELRALDQAAWNPSPAVRDALLWAAKRGPDIMRVNAAMVLLEHYCGVKDVWGERPWVLKLIEDSRDEQKAAYQKLETWVLKAK